MRGAADHELRQRDLAAGRRRRPHGCSAGLNGLANQNALYRQADPARIGSAAGLLRTFTYLGAMAASAADAAFFPHGADTGGMHRLALLMLAGAALLLAVTLIDRSLRDLTPRKA
ncbi:hypothetical protein ABZX90_02315 [Streptomyces sp. NPDC002935]|uniref:hypothetical protein n=1 Tax=Streptomyces sp. NPDC002935 TaxID=3154545 RepID=UPI0033B8BAE1